MVFPIITAQPLHPHHWDKTFFFLKVKGATRMRVSQRLFCSVLRLAVSNAWGYLWKHLMAKLLGLRHGSMTKFDRQILGNTESG